MFVFVFLYLSSFCITSGLVVLRAFSGCFLRFWYRPVFVLSPGWSMVSCSCCRFRRFSFLSVVVSLAKLLLLPLLGGLRLRFRLGVVERFRAVWGGCVLLCVRLCGMMSFPY